MKRVRKKTHLFFWLAVLILAIVAGLLVWFSFQQGTVDEKSKTWMYVIAGFAGVAGIAGIIGIILFFAKTYEVKEDK